VSREAYPLVWWLKKALPHRYGQRCCRAINPHGSLVWTPEPWENAEPGWRQFEFEDGTKEWGPKRGARYPNADYREDFVHADPDCTGEWVHAARGYACPRCDTWVRRNDQTRPVFERLASAEWQLRHNLKSTLWTAVFEAAERGTPPEEFVPLLLAADPCCEWSPSFILAARDAGLRVGP
jgi:hypothetical protein